MTRYKSISGVTGILLGIAALVYASIFPTETTVIAVMALLSLLLLGWFCVASLDMLQKLARKQATFLRLNNALLIVFFLFIVVLLNLIVRQYYVRVDLSAQRKHSLSPKSTLVTKAVDHEVDIMFFGVEGSKEYQRMHDLLEAYRYLNRNIVYQLYDLDRVPLKAKENKVINYNTLVFRSAGTLITAAGSDEEAVTNLLIRGTRRKTINIRYLQGHNEHPTSETDRDGYGKVLRQLRAQGYNLQQIDLKAASLRAAEVDLLVIASPRSELSGDEYEKIWHFQEEGGKLLILVDGPQQLTPLLRSVGVRVSDFPVYDSRNVAGTDPSSPLVTTYPTTPMTQNFGLSTVFPGVHALSYRDSLMLDYKFEPIVQTSPENWLEKNGNRTRDIGEENHPLTVAAMLSHPNKLMKMVIFGDSDFASNAYQGIAGNANLLLNVVNWLCGEGALVSVAPAKSEFVPMFISDQQARILRVLAPVGIPLCIVIPGACIWLWRRRL